MAGRAAGVEPAQLLYGRLLASAAAGGDPPEARYRLAGGGTAQAPARGAGSVPSTAPTWRSSPTPPGPCSTSAAGPAAISRRSPPPGTRGSGSTSRRSPCGWRGRAARRPSCATCSPTSRARAAGGRRSCSTATSGSAARPPRCSRGRASWWPAAASCSWRPAPPGRADPPPARAPRDARGGQPVVRLGDRRRGRDRGARARRRAPAGGRLRGGRALVRAAGAPAMTAPPGPFRPGFWRSPLRGPWLTAVLGSALLVLMTVVALTGFLSHAAYRPDLGRNALVTPDLPLPAFFPGGPSWLYALNQGLHVNVGLVVIPVVLAKLWSVIPRLFVWPPAATPAQALERASAGLLVASTGFQLATGVVNIQYWYVFDFDFVAAHYYGGVVFVAAFLLHLALKLPVAVRAYRSRGVLAPLRQDLAHTAQEPRDDTLVAAAAGPADDLPPRAAGRRGRRVARAGRGQRGRVDRRARCARRRSWRRGGRAASRSTRRPAARASARRWWTTATAWSLARRGRRRSPSRARSCSPCRRRPTRSRWGASRAGRRARRGPACRWPSSRAGPGSPSRASCSWSRSSPRASCARPRCRAARWRTSGRCSRCGSAARTCRSTTATRRGSSSRRCPASTTPSGSGTLTFRS